VSGAGREVVRLQFHFGERARAGDKPLEAAVMDACARRGVEAAALLRGVEGFGGKHRLRTDRLLSLSEDAPLVAVAVGEAERVEGLARDVEGMAGEGLLVMDDVHATTGPATGLAGVAAGPVVGGAMDGEGSKAVRVTVWGSRRGADAPHLEAVAAFRRHRADVATVLLGVDGVLGGERRRARFVSANRGVPAMTVAVGDRAAIDAALAEMRGAELVTVEGVERNSVIDRESHHGPPGVRVTLVTSEIAQSGGHPRYVELIRELRRRGAAGATAVRGVWGYRGGEEPHGDRVLALRRDLPLIVETVDTPERAEEWGELARALAAEGDVVYSQSVGGMRVLG
jgi:PII-like signaling protein